MIQDSLSAVCPDGKEKLRRDHSTSQHPRWSEVADLLSCHSNRQVQIDGMEDVLHRIAQNDQTDLPGISSEASRTRWWRMADRLSPTEIETLVERYRSGVKAAHLAHEYNISLSSVRRLLRKHGALRRPTNGEVSREDAL